MTLALGEPDPEVVAAAVRGCPAVTDLSAGVMGDAVTYLPGRRVVGVRIDDRAVTVHVVGRFGPTMVEIAGEVVAAVAPQARGRRVDVMIDDLTPPADLPRGLHR